jgi:hypothetical protein
MEWLCSGTRMSPYLFKPSIDRDAPALDRNIAAKRKAIQEYFRNTNHSRRKGAASESFGEEGEFDSEAEALNRSLDVTNTEYLRSS